MPLKLVPPRAGWSPYWRIRGTYLGVRVDRSTKARERKIAQKRLAKIEREIERGEFSEPGALTFAGAAKAYMEAGGERRFLAPIIKHFGLTVASTINQAVVDGAAAALYPHGDAATRNRQVYTPISAVLQHAGLGFQLRRPKGALGKARNTWLWPEEAERLFDAARKLDAEFATLLVVLCYTGARLSEILALETREVRLAEAFAYVGETKNDDPRALFLPPVVVAALGSHPRGMERDGAVFRFRKNGRLYSLWRGAVKASRLKLPPRSGFHILSHTWATWMRRYGKLDTKGLVGTGRWRDEKSAARYQHVVVSEESERAALLPGAKPVQKQ